MSLGSRSLSFRTSASFIEKARSNTLRRVLHKYRRLESPWRTNCLPNDRWQADFILSDEGSAAAKNDTLDVSTETRTTISCKQGKWVDEASIEGFEAGQSVFPKSFSRRTKRRLSSGTISSMRILHDAYARIAQRIGCDRSRCPVYGSFMPFSRPCGQHSEALETQGIPKEKVNEVHRIQRPGGQNGGFACPMVNIPHKSPERGNNLLTLSA